MSIFKTTEHAFGLDISDSSLRLVQLTQKNNSKKIIQFYNEVNLPIGAIKEGEIINPEICLEKLKELIKTKVGSGELSKEVVATLPESKTFLKVITIAKEKNTDIENKIKEIIPQHIPLDFENIFFNWQIISETPTNYNILIGTCPKNIVNSYTKLISQAGITPVVLEIEAAAIARALFPVNLTTDPQIVIDFGANRTGLFVYDNGYIMFTISLGISGNGLTKDIAKVLDIDQEKAEKIKLVCGLDRNKCHGALIEILSDLVDELIIEIKQAINFYEDNFGIEKEIKQITLCGGGANLPGISDLLKERLGLPVSTSDPWKNVINNLPNYFDIHRSQSYTTTIGLALRGIDHKNLL